MGGCHLKYFNFLFYAGVKVFFHPGVNFSILFPFVRDITVCLLVGLWFLHMVQSVRKRKDWHAVGCLQV